MKFRNIKKYVLLDISTSDMTSALAYPVTESDGIYFWSRLLERFGLIYLCTPKHGLAPDAYFAIRSKLDERACRLIREGLETGNLDPLLLDKGIVLGVEFESKASHATKHFDNVIDGREHISLICCNENDWSGEPPVPIWSLHDHLGILKEPESPEAEPTIVKPMNGIPTEPPDDEEYTTNEEEYERINKSIKSERQCFVLMAFLFPGIRKVQAEEGYRLELNSEVIKDYANKIAARNSKEPIKDVGGVLTAFTQEGAKRKMKLLIKGDRAGRGCNYYLPVRYKPYIERCASVRYLEWKDIINVNS